MTGVQTCALPIYPIREKIRKTIGQVAKAHGIANVVDAGAVVFGGKDLTEEVIAAVAQGK